MRSHTSREPPAECTHPYSERPQVGGIKSPVPVQYLREPQLHRWPPAPALQAPSRPCSVQIKDEEPAAARDTFLASAPHPPHRHPDMPPGDRASRGWITDFGFRVPSGRLGLDFRQSKTGRPLRRSKIQTPEGTESKIPSCVIRFSMSRSLRGSGRRRSARRRRWRWYVSSIEVGEVKLRQQSRAAHAVTVTPAQADVAAGPPSPRMAPRVRPSPNQPDTS